ncbi:hypothetical protein GCM10010172_16330 [Paractinoplanes ferrugineus]|uniref:Uncharacterized protein n=1 Tax=Paractinoplanes ferrugineus TaxID=113564 RepID=A0A919IYE3_9ACTN|nr:hypothetical protein [Actinoplanes ferrugineus]GIE10197.1 hypothetical protein Afe05nite_20370 [Actinoplanes ferrugineus]
MTAPENAFLFVALMLAILMSSAYALGRIHQWHKNGLERDEAYRRGYDKASVSILGIMTSQKPAAVEKTRPALVGHAPVLTAERHTRNRRTPIDRPQPRPVRRAEYEHHGV